MRPTSKGMGLHRRWRQTRWEGVPILRCLYLKEQPGFSQPKLRDLCPTSRGLRQCQLFIRTKIGHGTRPPVKKCTFERAVFTDLYLTPNLTLSALSSTVGKRKSLAFSGYCLCHKRHQFASERLLPSPVVNTVFTRYRKTTGLKILIL